MNNKTFPFALVIACLIGGVQIYWLIEVFSFFVMYAMPLEWLGILGLRGTPLTFGVAIVDLIIATVFSIPAAFVLLKLQPQKIIIFVTLAVITGFLMMYGSLFINPSRLFELWPGVMMGWINLLLPIPLAVLLLRKPLLPKTPNKSLNADASDAGAG